MKNLLLAAETGDAGFQFNLGVVYDNGVDDNGCGIKRMRAKAIEWLLKAARQGLPRAQARLAEIYADGTGKPGDAVKAHAWFTVGGENLTGAYRRTVEVGLERISLRMTPAEIAKARRLAVLCRADIVLGGEVAARAAKGRAAKEQIRDIGLRVLPDATPPVVAASLSASSASDRSASWRWLE